MISTTCTSLHQFSLCIHKGKRGDGGKCLLYAQAKTGAEWCNRLILLFYFHFSKWCKLVQTIASGAKHENRND